MIQERVEQDGERAALAQGWTNLRSVLIVSTLVLGLLILWVAKLTYQLDVRMSTELATTADDVEHVRGRLNPDPVRRGRQSFMIVEGEDMQVFVPATKQLWELRGQQVEGHWEVDRASGLSLFVVSAWTATQRELPRLDKKGGR